MIDDDDYDDYELTDEDLASGRFVIIMRKNGKIVRDADGKAIPRTLHQHKKVQTALETEEMQKEATRLMFS